MSRVAALLVMMVSVGFAQVRKPQVEESGTPSTVALSDVTSQVLEEIKAVEVKLVKAAEDFLGKAYSPILKVPYGNPAWDVYLAFGADVRWGDSTPAPTYWEMQTGGGDASRLLNGPRFGGEIQKLLTTVNKK